ncbi:hypothetical protein [Shewanella sp.]|uniref:hypothetical protein n=1 Tax=Shewanella sp. TaxID=50422 RepID=UPI0035665AA6
MKSSPVVTLLLLLTPLPALAFAPSGSMATMALLLGLGGFTLLNLIAQLSFFASGFYRSRRFVRRHVLTSLPPVLLGGAAVVMDHQGTADLLMNVGLLLIALAFALLPYLFAEKVVTSRPWISVITALLYLGLGCFIGPITTFAIILAHVAWFKQDTLGKYLCMLVLCLGYPLLGYYLYQLLGKL